MTAVPPLDEPSDQVNPMIDFVVTDGLLAKLIGASGTKTTMPPFPTGEDRDYP